MKVQITALHKRYGRHTHALKNINLTIDTGMFGLLGPNGAGKTTLLRILATLLKPTNGRVLVDGFDVTHRQQKWVIKKILGYLPQELGLYPNLTVHEFLDYIGTLKYLHEPLQRTQKVKEIIHTVGLEAKTHARIQTLSGGMKRRVGIAQALLGDPKLLIVDEPTVGLDPEERVRFRVLLSQLASDRIIILSTHIVEDIANTCQNLAILHQGQVRFHGTPQALMAKAVDHTWEVTLPTSETPNPSWHIAKSIHNEQGHYLRVVGPRPHAQAKAVRPSLEDAYLLQMSQHRGEGI